MYRITLFMDPGAPAILEEIKAKLAEVVGLKSTFEKQLEENRKHAEKINSETQAVIEKQREEVIAKFTAVSDQVKSQEQWQAEIQSEVNSKRFGADGSIDQLRNALPEDVRPMIERFRWLTPERLQKAGFSSVAASATCRLAQKDPVLVTAIAEWFRCRIMGPVSIKRGNIKLAEKFNERAMSLAKPMGGFAQDQIRTMQAEYGASFDPNVDIAQKADLTEGTDATGGYLVPVITEAVIGWLMKEASVVRGSGATVLQMTAPIHELPTLDNDFSGNWDIEGQLITDAAPASPFGSGQLVARRRSGLVTPTIELIQDSLINLFTFVLENLIQQEGRADDTQLLEGTGAIFTGLFSAAGVNSVAPGAGAITWESFVKLAYAGEHSPTIDGGVYWTHPWAVRDLITKGVEGPTDNKGFSLVSSMMISLSPEGSLTPTVIGNKRVYTTSVISRTRGGGTESTLYHGKPAYIIIGERMGMQFEANPFSEAEWKRGKISLRLLRRVGGLIWVGPYFSKYTQVQLAA